MNKIKQFIYVNLELFLGCSLFLIFVGLLVHGGLKSRESRQACETKGGMLVESSEGLVCVDKKAILK